jgi:hypothetical protein
MNHQRLPSLGINNFCNTNIVYMVTPAELIDQNLMKCTGLDSPKPNKFASLDVEKTPIRRQPRKLGR